MKYIVTVDDAGQEDIFLFPNRIHHDAMAEMLGHIKNQTHGNWKRIYRAPVAAGFVSPDNECYGHSETLNLKARPKDTDLLKTALSQS